MKRICLKTDSLQLVELTSYNDKNNAVWMTIVLNDVVRMAGIQAGYDNGGKFFQNWSSSRLVLLDHPILHRREGEENMPLLLLEDIIGEGVRLYFKRNNSSMRKLLGRKITKDADLEKFKPENWGGKKLAIPVEFIRIGAFQCHLKNCEVYASVQLGHHMVINQALIYANPRGFFFEDGAVKDSRLRSAIEQMIITDKALQEYVLRQSQKGISDYSGKSFVDKTAECDPEGLPPPVSFC